MNFEESQGRQPTFSSTSNGDFYIVRFLGGPLDGGEIVTDERPNNDYFVHRLASREYRYRYRRLTSTLFRAEYDVLLSVEAGSKRKPNTRYRTYLLLLVPILIIVWLISWSAI